MQFDIFKRSTKHARFRTFEAGLKPKLSPKKTEALYTRLVTDGKNRLLRIRAAEDQKVKVEATRKLATKKITAAQGEALYQRLVRKSQKVAEKVKAERRKKEEQAEKEIKELRKMHKAKNVNPKELVARMYRDLEKRKIKLDNLKKAQQDKENEAVTFFG